MNDIVPSDTNSSKQHVMNFISQIFGWIINKTDHDEKVMMKK